MKPICKHVLLASCIISILIAGACKERKSFRDSLAGNYFCHIHKNYKGQYIDSLNNRQDFTDHKIVGQTTVSVEKSDIDSHSIIVNGLLFTTMKRIDSTTIRYGTSPGFVWFYHNGDSIEWLYSSEKSHHYTILLSYRGYKVE